MEGGRRGRKDVIHTHNPSWCIECGSFFCAKNGLHGNLFKNGYFPTYVAELLLPNLIGCAIFGVRI